MEGVSENRSLRAWELTFSSHSNRLHRVGDHAVYARVTPGTLWTILLLANRLVLNGGSPKAFQSFLLVT